MEFRLEFAPRVLGEVEAIREWIAARSVVAAKKW